MKKDDIFKIYSSMCEVRIYGEGGLVPFGKIPRWHQEDLKQERINL